MQPFQARGDFFRRDGVHGLVEIRGVEIEQERQGERARGFEPTGGIERRTIHHAFDPWLLAELVGEVFGERVEVDLASLIEQADGQFARLAEFAVEGLERLHRLEMLGQQIQHVGREMNPEDDRENGADEHHEHARR